jgi:hypothetical protein
MTPECDFDHGDCDNVLPGQQDFLDFLDSTSGPVTCDALLASASGSGSADGSSSPLPPTDPMEPPTDPSQGGPQPGGAGRRLLDHSGGGPECAEGSTAVSCVLQGMTEAECKMADDNGDGLTAYEMFGLYYMLAAKQKLFADYHSKNVFVAMSTFAYLGLPWHAVDGMMPGGEPVTLKNLASFLDGMDHLFAGGTDELDWPESADKKNVDFLFGEFEHDTDPDTLTLPEAYARGLAGGHNDLFGWFDINDDGYVTKDEAMMIYETVVEDGQKGRFVCGDPSN